MRIPIAAICACLIATACQSNSERSLDPLPRLEVHSLEATGGLSSKGISAPEEGSDPLRRHRRGGTRYMVEVHVVSMDPETARRLTGWQQGDERAFTTRRWDAERVLRFIDSEEEEGAEQIASPRIALFAGEAGSLYVLDQRAYVKGFDVEYGDGVALADPVVGVFTDGIAVALVARPTDRRSHLELEVELLLADLCDPIPEYETTLLSPSSKVTIQQPVAATQRLKAKVQFNGGEEAVVLVGQMLDGSDRLLFAFLTAERVRSGERHSLTG